MREHVEELEDVLGYDEGTGIPHRVAEYMVTQLSTRFSRFLIRWNGNPDDAQLAMLIKIGQFLVKLQQATLNAQRQSLEMPKLRRQAELEREQELEMAHAFAEYCFAHAQEEDKVKPSLDANANKTVPGKTPVRTQRKTGQSRSIKVDQGSRARKPSPPESTEPDAVEKVESGQAMRLAEKS